MVAANGVTVLGLPYHYTVHRVLDSAGNEVSSTARARSGGSQLPGGGIWSAGGRDGLHDRETVGSWPPSERPGAGV